MDKQNGACALKGIVTNTDAALVVGASGGIGSAVLQCYLQDTRFAHVIAVSRGPCPGDFSRHHGRLHWLRSDYSEASIASITHTLAGRGVALRSIVISNGILHNGDLQPEKALEKVSGDAMATVFAANVIVPALWVSHLARLLQRSARCNIAVLSARVGSISDNRLGGWYSYRTAKAALNMFLQTAAIEYARRAPGVKLVAFHPGTTDTALSRPFQKGVAEGKLFAPAFVAQRLVALQQALEPDGKLSFLDWDGKTVPW
ncbi:MAG: SDR family NAD(P)-dependent oxidoreductase [Haliea sp.]|nr:SDR family NAD(P)-dependent oxidoreductase [Haliea sp.]